MLFRSGLATRGPSAQGSYGAAEAMVARFLPTRWNKEHRQGVAKRGAHERNARRAGRGASARKPLRERGDDVLLLAEYFAARYATQYGRPIPRLGPEAFALLYEHPWPGNIRELRAAMERAVLLAEGGTILPSHLLAGCGRSG